MRQRDRRLGQSHMQQRDAKGVGKETAATATGEPAPIAAACYKRMACRWATARLARLNAHLPTATLYHNVKFSP